MQLTRRAVQIGVGALLVSAGAAAGINSASGAGSSRAVARGQASRPRAGALPRQLDAAFAVFRHPAAGSPRLPKAAAFTGTARYAGRADGGPVWLVAGDSQSCIAIATGGGACAPNAVVARTGVVVGLVPVSGGSTTVIGIVPDGARVVGRSAAGARRTVGLSGNAFAVRSSSGLVSFTVLGSKGARQTTLLPRPAPPSSPPASRPRVVVRHGTAPAGSAAAKPGPSGPGKSG